MKGINYKDQGLRQRVSPLLAAWAVAWGELRYTRSEPRMLVFLLVLPIIFAAALALFQADETGPLTLLVRWPQTPFAQRFVDLLRREDVRLEMADGRARSLVARSERNALIILPGDFDAQLQQVRQRNAAASSAARAALKLEVLTAPGNVRSSEVFTLLRAVAAEFELEDVTREGFRVLEPEAGTHAAEDAVRRARGLFAGELFRFSLESVGFKPTEGTRERESVSSVATGSAQTTPGMMLMFALFFGAQTGVALQRERQRGTLARLLASPVHPLVLALGKVLGNTLLLVFQLALMLAFGTVVLGVHWGDPLALALPVLAFALACSAFGLACAGYTSSRSQLTAFSSLGITVAAGLGGLWWPLELTPHWLQVIAHLTPTFWAIDAVQDVMLRGAPIASGLDNALVLLGFASLFLLFGRRAYRLN